MDSTKFISIFSFTLLFVGVILYSLSLTDEFGDYVDIGWYGVLMFSVISIYFYVATERLEDTEKKYKFINLTMTNMVAKMILSAGLVTVYYITKTPGDGKFIVPFIIVYVIFTVFETYFMNDQAKAR